MEDRNQALCVKAGYVEEGARSSKGASRASPSARKTDRTGSVGFDCKKGPPGIPAALVHTSTCGSCLDAVADGVLAHQRLGPFFDRGPMAKLFADVNLARTCDLLLGIAHHLGPLRQPSGSPRDREKHWEHRHRETHRLIGHAGVEIYVRIELACDEVVVLERDPLEFERNVDERILAGFLEHLVCEPLDNLGARVVALVDAMAEAHHE